MNDQTRPLLLGEHTDPGPRDSNQDTVLSAELSDGRWLVAVADGMGGLADGERAGKTALATLYRSLTGGAELNHAVREANAAVHKESKGQSMGTTLVAAVLDGSRAEVANVGDSRAYHLDPLGLLQVTRDHTMGEEAVRNGALGEGQLSSSLWAGALARFLGAQETVEADIFGPLVLGEGDWLLLCSDGLHRVLPDRDIEARLRGASDPKQAAVRLVEMALERKTQDNVSVVLVYRPEKEEENDSVHGAGPVLAFGHLPETGRSRSAGVPGKAGSARGSSFLRDQERGKPTPSAWDPKTLFTRSPRNGQGRRPYILAAIVILASIALLIAGFVALDRVMSL